MKTNKIANAINFLKAGLTGQYSGPSFLKEGVARKAKYGEDLNRAINDPNNEGHQSAIAGIFSPGLPNYTPRLAAMYKLGPNGYEKKAPWEMNPTPDVPIGSDLTGNVVQNTPAQAIAPVANGNVLGVTDEPPKNIMDFYAKYKYAGRGKFASPLTPDYIKDIWSEINKQAPKEATKGDKIAFLNTMLSATHQESHGGYDAGGLKRNSNVWNMGYNSTPGSSLKFDPKDRKEAAKYAVNQFINTFGLFKNKGFSDHMIHRYHKGTEDKIPYDQAGVDAYRRGLNTWTAITGAQYPWGQN